MRRASYSLDRHTGELVETVYAGRTYRRPEQGLDVHVVNNVEGVVAKEGGVRLHHPGRYQDAEKTRILLGLLESVERDKAQSQRRLAADLGIALGLVNAYLKRCVRKGLVKIRRAPARRYAYYLTPLGFAEKSRLTIEYLSYSLDFFRQAKSDCGETLAAARRAQFSRVVLAGRSDLAEIAIICALENGIDIIAVVDPTDGGSTFAGRPRVTCFDEIKQPFDAIVVTDIVSGQLTYDRAVAALGGKRVLFPKLLRIKPNEAEMS